MKTKFYFSTLLLLLLLTAAAFSQSPNWLWAKAMGGTDYDGAAAIAIDASGNVYSTGLFEGTADFDPGPGIFNLTAAVFAGTYISKLDGSGNFVWAKEFSGTSGYGYGHSIALDASGNVYTTGTFAGTADFDPGPGIFNLTATIGGYDDFFISKLDSAGNFIWAKAIGGTGDEIGYSITIDTAGDGNVYTTGTFQNTADFDPGAGTFNLTSAGDDDIFISKLDSSGNFVWAKQMGGIGDDYSYSITVDPAGSGDVYITGYGIFISKLDSSGNFIWTKVLGGGLNGSGKGYSIVLDPAGSGNIYTTGIFGGTVDFDPGAGVFNLTSVGLSGDIFISKLDSSGNFVWAKAMGGCYDGFSVLDPAGSGDIYTSGSFCGTADFDPGTGVFNLTSAGSEDVFISKLDASGNFVWAKAINGTGEDHGQAIALDPSGNGDACIAGYFGSSNITFGSITITNTGSFGTNDIFIAKLDHITGIESVVHKDSFSVYPNPSNGEFTIDINEMQNQEQYDISIYNMLGEKVFSTIFNFQFSIFNLNAPNGIYFLHIKSENNSITQKLIIQK